VVSMDEWQCKVFEHRHPRHPFRVAPADDGMVAAERESIASITQYAFQHPSRTSIRQVLFYRRFFAQKIPNPVSQHIGHKRLRKELPAAIQYEHPGWKSGDQQDFCLGPLLIELGCQFDPRHSRHVNVRQKHVNHPDKFTSLLKRFLPILCNDDPVAAFEQQGGNQFLQLPIVIGKQNCGERLLYGYYLCVT